MKRMGKRFTILYRTFFVLFVLLLVGLQRPVSVQAESKVIRVGYFDQCGIQKAGTGEYSGYAVEYLEKIAEHTGWEYEYIPGSWSDCMEMLETGEVDLVCMVRYYQEYTDRLLYADLPMGHEYTILYARGESDIYYQDYQAMAGCRIGMLKEAEFTDEVRAFMKEDAADCEPVYYDTEQEVLDAIRSGNVDLAIVRSLHSCEDLRMVNRFEMSPFYCVTSQDNAVLMDEINLAMEQVKVGKPELESELHEKYYGSNKVSCEPLYTREEQKYIQESSPITIKLMLGSYPLSYRKNGEYAGVFAEYIDLLSEISGLEFQMEEIESTSFEEQTKQIVNEDYLLLHAERSIEAIGLDEQLISSIPMFETKLAYVIRQDSVSDSPKEDMVFAITNEMNYLPPLLYSASEQYEVKTYDNTQECLDAVLKQEADLAIQDSYVVSYWMQKPRYANKLVERPGQDVETGICVVASMDNRMLVDIINKTIQYISDEEKEQAIEMALLVNAYENDVGDILYAHWQWILCIGLILVAAVYIYSILLSRITALQTRKKDYEKLQKRVQQDELTGVYNRTYFYKKAREMVDNAEDEMCIVLMDISNFKVVNDLYGMENGDKLLHYMAQELLRLGEGKEFIVARFTGDHFYMCMKKNDFYDISFPKRYKTFLEDIDITVTYGVFMIEGQKDVPINIMCDRAKMAAHDRSKKRVEYIRYYSDEEREQILHEQEIESAMEKALEARQFCVYVQPKYNVEDEKVVGGEALVRWIHPNKGMVPPGEFISIFEKNGFIIRLDYYVWEETCRFLSDLKKKGLGGYPISINVSRAHFYGVELQEKLEELMAKYELSPEELELEITETICAEDPDIIYKIIRELQEAGFKVAMDDFGSGYSSLNMLKEMSLDIIKMDMKFMDGGENEEKSRTILQTLIQLAHNMKLKVVVEGVETKEQVEFLREIGNCDIQGYYFSRPIECDAYEDILRKEKKN